METEKDILTLYNNNNEQIDFFLLHTLTVDRDEYLLLEEAESPEKTAIILKRDKDTLSGIQDEDEYRIIRDLFKEKFEETELE